VVEAVGQAHLFQKLRRPLQALPPGPAREEEGKGHVLQGGEGGDQVPLLENEAHVPEAHPRPIVLGEAVEGGFVQEDPALRGQVKAGEEV
jgi:hypothetical protein